MTKKMRQKNYENSDEIGIGDLVRYYATDGHGIVVDGGIALVMEIFESEDLYELNAGSTMYRLLLQEESKIAPSKLLWFSEQEVLLYKKVT